jgi:hypothetical protein
MDVRLSEKAASPAAIQHTAWIASAASSADFR